MATKSKMKVPTARQLPSGSWFCRVRINGQDIPITRPTEKEAVAEAMALKAGLIEAEAKPRRLTVSKAIDEYIAARENVLSPSTIRGYRGIQRQRFQTMMCQNIHDLTSAQWQRAVNLEAKMISAKTLKNAWGFISSVIADQTGNHIQVRLPQVVANDLPFLTAEQIPVFLNQIHGNRYEIPMLLALSSLRRSEILAVRWEDIDLEAGCIHVHGSAVWNDSGELVYRKENKNTTSRRTVPFLIPQLRTAVLKAEKTGEYVVSCGANVLCKNINRACAAAGLPEVGTHGLRRSFASLAYHLGIPEEVTMRAGGWCDIYTMRKIYTKISEVDMHTQGAKFESFFHFDNENGNENKKSL